MTFAVVIIVLTNLMHIIGFIGLMIVLFKLNKALDIWLEKNKRN